MNEQTRSYPAHDCYEWNKQVYFADISYVGSRCILCDHITGFKWRSWRRHFTELFK